MNEPNTISIYQLAEHLGVSTTTVSRVLNHRAGIGEKTRQRVWTAARDMGYRPKQSVRRRTVGLLVDHVDDDAMGSLLPRLTTNVMATLAKHDLVLEVFSQGTLQMMPKRYLDGILAIAWERDTIAALKTVKDVPVVIFNRPEYKEFSQVCSDFVDGGRQVAQLMLDYGHRRIGFVAAKEDMPVERMLAGFRGRLSEAGVDLPSSLTAFTQFQPPYAYLRRLLDQDITALWVCHPDLSYQAPYLYSELMGLDLPESLSIVGLDDSVRHQYSRPPMTIASENVHGLIDKAMKMLMEQIDNHDTTPHHATVHMELVVRDSLKNIR